VLGCFYVLRSQRSRRPPDAEEIADGHECVRADQDSTRREHARVGQAADNSGRGSVGGAGSSRAQLRGHPRNARDVGRKSGVFAREAHRQAIQRGRLAAQVELPSFAAGK
jgi:hypothetical protein